MPASRGEGLGLGLARYIYLAIPTFLHPRKVRMGDFFKIDFLSAPNMAMVS